MLLRCPACGCSGARRLDKVATIRRDDKHERAWRRYQCINCRHLFASVEEVVTAARAELWLAVYEPPILPSTGSSDTARDEDSVSPSSAESQAS